VTLKAFDARRSDDADGETREPDKRNFDFFRFVFRFQMADDRFVFAGFFVFAETEKVKTSDRKTSATIVFFLVNIFFAPF
jgi:hypothetical protein